VLLVGAKPRLKGMERVDLLKDNGKIFVDVGQALDQVAHRDVKTVVVGNPANTNCLILQSKLKRLPKTSVTAMSRLDHNRALAQLKLRLNVNISDIKHVAIWGNHSPTMYPYLNSATVGGKNLLRTVNDQEWVRKTFTECVQKRGTEILNFRGATSAASAGSSAMDHIRDWEFGSEEWLSMCIDSKGNTYGIDQNLVFSFPVKCHGGKYEVINGLEIDE